MIKVLFLDYFRDISHTSIGNSSSADKFNKYKSLFPSLLGNSIPPVPKNDIIITVGHNANSLSSINMIMTYVSKLIYDFFRGDSDALNLLKINNLR
jgi:hypothetical protein